MANENIKIVISESGSRVVIRNIRDIADSAESAAKSADKMNSSLGRSNNHNFGKLHSEFGKLHNSVTRTVYKIRQMMTLFAAFAGTTISTGAIVKAMDSYTNLQNRLKLVADSQAQVNQLTKEMFDISKRSRASVEDTAIAFSRFDLALKSVGRSQKDSLMVTETVNKMIAMSGKGSQEAGAALLQLSQAFSKGKLDGDEFRTVAETMPLLMDAIAKKMGVTRGELLELRKQGKLTLDVMIEAIRDAQPEVDKQFSSYKMRVSDSLTELKNQWIKFWGEMESKYSISQKISNGLMLIANNFHVLENIAVPAMQVLSVWAGVKLVTALKTMSFSMAGIAPVVSVVAAALYLLANSGTDFDKTARRLLIVVASLSAAFATWKLATLAAGFVQMAVAAGGLSAALVACRTAAIGAAVATKALLLNPITWGAAAVAVIVAIGVAMATAKSEAEQFDEFMRSIPETIGKVDDKVKQFYNESGIGRTISLRLGVDDSGVIGNSGYLKKLQDIGATAQKVNADMALSSEKTTAAIKANVDKIEATFKDAFAEISKSSNLTAEQRIQHEILTTERKQKLLQDQFEKLDETLSNSKVISSQEAEFRKKLEQSVYDESVRLMDLRTKYALEQMRKIRQEAIANASFLDKLMGEGGSLSFNENNKLSRYRGNKDSMPEIRSKELELLAQGVKKSKAEELAVASTFSAMSEGVAKGMSDFYSSPEGQKVFKSKSVEEQARLIELMRDHVKKTSDLLKETPGHYGLNEERAALAKMANTLAIMQKNRNKEKVTPTTKILREADPALQLKLKNQLAEADKKSSKVAKSSKSESQTFAEKTAQFAEKNARALDKYTGDCAKYINRAVEAFAKNYKRAGSGINVARNAVATGKYKWVKFDENYTPQVGDIQSMSSWTKLGRIHGHSSMFTKSGWVSDAKQKTYGDGRIGAAGYDQYNKLKNGIGQLMIARPIDSKVDNRTYNKIYEQQEKSLEKQIDYYNQIIEKIEKETQSLNIVGNVRLADMKTMEMMDSLKQHDVDLTTEQVAKVAELALKYEEAKVAQELREVAEGREKELAHLRAITIEEKAIAAFNDYIASKRKEGIFYTDEQLAKLREESIEHAKILELEQAKLNVHKSQVAEVEKLRMEQQAIMDMMASGEIGGQYAGRKMLANQTAIGRANQAQGLTADGSAMGNSWQEVFGAIMLGKDQLLEGYTGTLNDLTDQFGTFFTSIQDGFADSIGKAIVQGDNLGESLKNAAKQGLQSLISGLVKLGTQWVITQLLMSTSSKATSTAATTQGTAQAASLTSAYAPAATLANTATFGSASVAGMAGMMAVVALAAALPAMLGKGFMTGGYTGSMATDQIAGVVHGQEYVFDADATRRIGVHNLEALRNGNLSLPGKSSSGGSVSSGVNITIQNYASGVTHEVEQIDEDNIRIIARQEAQAVVSRQAGRVVAGELANPNSPVSKAMSNNIQAKRKTS